MSTITHNIIVDLQKRRLTVADEHGFILEEWPVSIGSEEHPTPTGRYCIYRMEDDPYNVYQVYDGDDSDVYGTRCIELSIRLYDFKSEIWRPMGIHGTSYPERVGEALSIGCIVMLNKNIEILYNMVEVGCEVSIVG